MLREAPGSSKPVWIAFAVSLVLALLVYKPALHGQFVFDDLHLPFSDPAAHRMGIGFWIGGVRPVLMFSYWLNFVVSGTDTFSYHLVNVLLHAVNTALVFAVVRRLAKLKNPVLADPIAWLCAGIFLLHPLQTEAVSYIAGRSELMGALFLLLSWLTFLNSRETLSPGRCVAVISLAGCAVLSKESAISLPLVLFASDVFRFGGIRAAFQANRWFYWVIGMAAVGGSIAILMEISGQAKTGLNAETTNPLLYAFSESRAIWIYIRLFFLPFGQNGDWGIPIYRSFLRPAPLAYSAGIVAALYLIFRFGRRNHLFVFGVCLFALTIAPSSSFIPLPDVVAERRMYVPIMGLALGVAALLPAKLMIGRAAAWLILPLSLLAVVTSVRAAVWVDRYTFWNNAVSGNPENPRAHFGLGGAYAERRQYDKALDEFNKVRAATDDTPQLLSNMAEVLQARGSIEQALAELRILVKLEPSSINYTNLGLAEARLGYSDQAMLDFDAALRRNPENAIAYAYRGLAEASLKRPQEAIRDVRRAIAIDPDNEIVRYASSQVGSPEK